MDEERDIQLITGPNMSGKSTYAPISVIDSCQIGSYVPTQRSWCQSLIRLYPDPGAADDHSIGSS